MAANNYPLSPLESLKKQFVGKKIEDLDTPAILLDRAIIKKNCAAMLNVCSEFDVGFRAHVKSHKTLELSKLQVGETGPADFIVSTIIEAEQLAPYLGECQMQGREASVLYGVPIPQSAIPRIIRLAKSLAPRSVHIIVDNEDAFLKFHQRLLESESNVEIGIFIKIDTGYQRAGITTESPNFNKLVKTVSRKTSKPGTFLKGFYSHLGHSYAGNSDVDAAKGLIKELMGLEFAIENAPEAVVSASPEPLVLSVGATPTATAAQNLLHADTSAAQTLHTLLKRLGSNSCHVELHAGVYPLLDCQQVATHARPSSGKTSATFQTLSNTDIAIRMLVEVSSVYTERAKPEALISAGSLAMGREPCKSYPGWGIVTPALGNAKTQSVYDEKNKTGWIVGRISQEHGILTWEGERSKCNALAVGDKVSIWPNHACVAGAGFGWYLVVDSEEGGDRVVDVWVRWRGW
ncbi:hypothetical protein NX059_003145 [Plenodomus lindquistii]|nr:hypothetical protein NX059_003145 [Plenodomus lindquistii]